jgi:hypothetical protein
VRIPPKALADTKSADLLVSAGPQRRLAEVKAASSGVPPAAIDPRLGVS